MPGTKKTDNHYTADKVALRIGMISGLDRVRVLDAYGGHGVVWAAARRITGKDIQRTSVDQRLDLDAAHLHGDNIKVLAGLDMSKYDVIDLDAYGIPAAQIYEVVVKKRFKGIVFVTAVQTMQGAIPRIVTDQIGLPRELIRDCPSLAARNGWEYFKAWLAALGVREIRHRSKGRKHYLAFDLSGAERRAAGCGSLPAGILAGPS